MPAPYGFSWVEKPVLAGMAQPESVEELTWLRDHGIQLLISLSEEPPPREWINEAGLLSMHVPIEDMQAPSVHQIELCMSAIQKAHGNQMGVGIHCTAGMGRTGTILACYFVTKELSAQSAIAKVRELRPGSVETPEQAEAVADFARKRKGVERPNG
jgi:atypical dual specificity phosphatase